MTGGGGGRSESAMASLSLGIKAQRSGQGRLMVGFWQLAVPAKLHLGMHYPGAVDVHAKSKACSIGMLEGSPYCALHEWHCQRNMSRSSIRCAAVGEVCCECTSEWSDDMQHSHIWGKVLLWRRGLATYMAAGIGLCAHSESRFRAQHVACVRTCSVTRTRHESNMMNMSEMSADARSPPCATRQGGHQWCARPQMWR